ncbi:MAG: LacI family DNA-binding transcriptional regulator [Deltaproteobacteria bacterium]|nr:MAG: LacI family DNA-binding transcriptional regulator [Deltaproteobacteria bacterium]TMB10846.1 MAG: LacI family DNA-binding transcriptional regulator [Deltaproteobacteria bacterium]
MTDVAKLAGVSHQTVSRVLHDSPHVRRGTRERVLKAIRQLDYRPNPVAQALVTGRSRSLGVVSFDTTLYGPASTLLGIEEAAHDRGYAVSIASLRSLNRESVVSAVQRLRDQGVDGVVVIAPQRAAVDALLHLPPEVPVVAVEAGPDNSVPVVAVDQHAGAAAATRHLLELGHRHIWHIAGPQDWLEAEQRIEGWRSALRAAGAAEPPLLRGDWSARSGYDVGEHLLAEAGVTAVFVANDQMALGLLRRLHEAGRETPGEISVVGFDDIPEAAYFTPPLTTVRQDFAEVGRRCLHLLLGQIESRVRSWSRVVVAPELVVRRSTTAARDR